MRAEPTSASRNAESAHEAHRHDGRKPAESDAVERFRALLEQAQGRQAEARHEAAHTPDDTPPAAESERVRQPDPVSATDPGWMQNIQRVWLEQAAAPASATQAAPPPAATLADLVERHVRQLLVGESTASGDANQVMLRLSDDTLPDTDLLLTRSTQGWTLRVEAGRAESARSVQQGVGQLVERFRERHLGRLDIEVVSRDQA